MVEIENINAEIIATINNNEIKTKAVEIVKENKEKFTKKKIYLENKEEQLYVKKVESK